MDALIEIFAFIGFTATLLTATFLLLALIGDIKLKKLLAGEEQGARGVEFEPLPVVTRLRFGGREQLFGTGTISPAHSHEFTRAS